MKKINNQIFKSAMGKFATGVTIVTINKNNIFIGKTVNSFTSLSLNPPLILFSLNRDSTYLKEYLVSKFLGINILSNKQKELSYLFSKKTPKWGLTKTFLTKNNTPMIKDSVINLNCQNYKTIPQGDHIIFICKVLELKNTKYKPLIYLNSQYS